MQWDDIPPVLNYLIVHAPGHPLANARGHVRLHRWLLYRRIGDGPHPCNWCGIALAWHRGGHAGGALVVDHLDGHRAKNDDGNLVPSCNPCNVARRRTRVKPDEPHVVQRRPDGTVRGRLRAVEMACEWCGRLFPVEHARLKKKGDGRFCSHSCSERTAAVGPRASASGERNHHAALTEDAVREMRRLWAAGGITLTELGARFGVSKAGAEGVVYRRSWKHVT